MLENTGKINKTKLNRIYQTQSMSGVIFFFDYLHCGSIGVPDSPPTPPPPPPVGKLQLI